MFIFQTFLYSTTLLLRTLSFSAFRKNFFLFIGNNHFATSHNAATFAARSILAATILKNTITMAEETSKVTEKVYCYDHPSAYNGSNNAATAAMCAAMMNGRQNNDPMAMAAMMNGMGGQWNNPLRKIA